MGEKVKKYRAFLALILLPLLAACAGDAVVAQSGTGSKYVFENQSYQRVWRAAMAAAGRNMTVNTSNEAGGVIRGNAAGTEEIGIFLRRDRSDPLKTEVEVAGGKRSGMTITSSFYKSPPAKNWPMLIYREMEYELANMDQYDTMAAAPRPSSLRLEDMTPEMRSSQGKIRSQVQEEIRAQMPAQVRDTPQIDVRAQIREEVRLQMEQEMRQRMQDQAAAVAPRSARPLTAPSLPSAAPTAPAAPSIVMAPLPKTTLTPRERLRELKALYQDQLISNAEYESKKAAILKDL